MVIKVKEIKQEVSNYQFSSLGPNLVEGVRDHKFPAIDKTKELKAQKHQDVIRLERKFEKQKKFLINDNVRKSRGIVDQEQTDLQNAIAKEVEIRLAKIKDEAFARGLEEGKEEGYLAAKLEAQNDFQRMISDFSDMIQRTQEDVQDLYLKNKLDALRMIRNLTKWVILRELKEDNYLDRLLERLILEINTKNNLVVRVSSKNLEEMPGVIERVQRKVGGLTNTRVEVELDLGDNSIILESENGIIDGSLDAQFESIDKLFESVGLEHVDKE